MMFEVFWKLTTINLAAFFTYSYFATNYFKVKGLPDPKGNNNFYFKFGLWLFLTIVSVFVTVVWFIVRL